ncbi:MAG TPA: glycosyltransferase family 4 protein [Candidatus Nitrosocosmicus sp.]|nr:glycosyltransferase family 4 protein [Candidatus Nitrosocosmicus sp.]
MAASPPRGADLVVGCDLDGFLWARRRGRRPFVVMLKGIIADELRNERGLVRALLGVQARWERRNTARADAVVVPSRYSAAVAAEVYGVPAARIGVVPEGIDLAAWRARLAAAPRRPRPGPTVLAVGRTYARKRFPDLLHAAARLKPAIPGLRVRVVGKGPEWDALVRLHAELGLGDTVALRGDVTWDELAEEYVNADCFCLPSVQEGFGIVFLEAMAAGLPVVACRAAAVPEVVREGETGVLVPPRAPPALADALADLLRSPERARALGGAARVRVADYAVERVAERFLDTVRSYCVLP